MSVGSSDQARSQGEHCATSCKHATLAHWGRHYVLRATEELLYLPIIKTQDLVKCDSLISLLDRAIIFPTSYQVPSEIAPRYLHFRHMMNVINKVIPSIAVLRMECSAIPQHLAKVPPRDPSEIAPRSHLSLIWRRI